MKRLITGNGKSGSWRIRGEQLGAAIGATVDANPRKLTGYDQMILVKRPKMDALQLAGRARVPVVYDVVDAWQSRIGNDRSRSTCLRWLSDHISLIGPAAIVTTTAAMAEDCSGFGLPVLALPHHARPEQPINPIRQKVTTIGYEGSERYLGHWRETLEGECSRRGWKFVVNPQALADLDIVVAVREDDGYAPRHWKSNVKLANAQGSGTPCVLNRERGYLETACRAECWADTPQELTAAFDLLDDHAERLERSERLKRATLHLPDIAKRYKAWLDEVALCVANS